MRESKDRSRLNQQLIEFSEMSQRQAQEQAKNSIASSGGTQGPNRTRANHCE